jgi:carbon starvation protein CstA
VISFALGCVVLIAGYAVYGRMTEAAVRPDPNRPTPAIRLADGMDYVVIPTWRVYLIQLLNIAGLGPVFGPIMGALWGPQVFLWIVLGCILGGAVHDLLSGAMSIRNDGAGLPALIGHYLGRTSRHIATAFILLLMVLVGTVFVKGPALLIVQILPAEAVAGLFGDDALGLLTAMVSGQSVWLWMVMAAIFCYHIVATLLPIDVIIGRVYPFLGLALLVMVAGLGYSIVFLGSGVLVCRLSTTTTEEEEGSRVAAQLACDDLAFGHQNEPHRPVGVAQGLVVALALGDHHVGVEKA